MAQLSLFNEAATPRDVAYTQREVAQDIIQYCHPTGKVLDPCRGDGAFYDQFPATCDRFYCEIAEGLDFYKFTESVDWIIGNPPYSIFYDWMQHSFKLTDNIVYLVPTNKIFQSQKLIRSILRYGGLKALLAYGSGTGIGLPFGFSVGAFYFQRNYRGLVDVQFRLPPPILKRKEVSNNGKQKR